MHGARAVAQIGVAGWGLVVASEQRRWSSGGWFLAMNFSLLVSILTSPPISLFLLSYAWQDNWDDDDIEDDFTKSLRAELTKNA